MANHEQAERDYMLGMKYQAIADKYQVTVNTVKSWKRRYKWDRVPKKDAPKKKNEGAFKKVCKQEKSMQVAVPVHEDGLTEKQRLFCLYYIKNFNATQAAIKAGYTDKYPGEMGYQLLQKPTLRTEIKRLKELKRQSIMINEDDIVERYMRIAFADMTDFAEFGTEEYPDIDAAGNTQIDYNGNVKMCKRSYLEFKDLTEVDGGLICEISMGRNGMKFKLEDRMKALDWLSNYFNMNPMNKHKQQYDNALLDLKRKQVEKDAW